MNEEIKINNYLKIDESSNVIIKENLNNNLTNPIALNKQFSLKINDKKVINKKNNSSCRICFCKDNLSINPLITPCKCSGSMKYIHVNCLKNWYINLI